MAQTTNVNRKELFNRIEELERFINSDKNRYLLTKDLFPDKVILNTKRNKDYQLIAKTIIKEYDNVISQTTIWRILKIKEYDIEEYNKLKISNLPIKATYEKLFKYPKMTTPKDLDKLPTLDDNNFGDKEEINFTAILENLRKVDNYLQNPSLEKVSLSELKNIDEALFKARKSLGKIIAKEYLDE